MKKTIALFVILSGLTIGSFGQTFYYNAYAFTFRQHHKKKDIWKDWEQWKECDIKIKMDADLGKIKVFAKLYQEYNIMKNEGKEVVNGDEIASLYCVDNNGIACRVKLLTRIDGSDEIYVEYSDLKWAYAVKSITVE